VFSPSLWRAFRNSTVAEPLEPICEVLTIDEVQPQQHLDQVAADMVEPTLNALIDAQADRTGGTSSR
jgi:hypothetical protein